MSKQVYMDGPNDKREYILVIEDYEKYRQLGFDAEKDHIDLYTIAELNRHDRVCDEHWFSSAVLWEKYRFAYFNRPTKEFEREYEVPVVGDSIMKLTVTVCEHVLFASRKEH